MQREDETIDELFGGRLKIFQKKRGYRFSIDAVLLAHFTRVKWGERVIDIGTGSGIISIILALRFPRSGKITGLELQRQLADMARRSVALNGLDDRVDVLQGDIRELPPLLEGKSFDVAVFNPPYRKAGSGRVNPGEERALARHEIRSTVADFLRTANCLLKDGGRVYLIYPARRMIEVLYRMRALGIEPKIMRIVYSRVSSDGDLVLVEGLKGGGEELKVLPPLFVYGDEGGYSKEVQEMINAPPNQW